MAMLDGGRKWLVLALGLFLISFGSVGLLVAIYALTLFAGGVVIVYSYGRASSEEDLGDTVTGIHRPQRAVQKIKNIMEQTTKVKNFDKRMTGASIIDDALQEVLNYTIRDYIKPWYRQLSDHDRFLLDIRQCVQKSVITFSSRAKEIDWMPYFTQRLVDDFASHIRLYRRAIEKKAFLPKEERETADIESIFFDLEVNMEDNMCRDLVCLNPESERQYLQDLIEVLLFLLLPKEDFYNKPFRYIVREVLVNEVFIPTIDLLSDPDYINQYIIWLCGDMPLTKETFLTVIKTSDSEAELDAVKDIVETEIAKWRSKDTGGSDDAVIKQNLNSLLFVRDTCEMRKKRLQQGPIESEMLPDEEPDFLKYHKLYILTLDDILNNNIALQSFIEFMTGKGGQQYLFFYLNVEGFRAAAEQQISEAHKTKTDNRRAAEPDLESLRRAAMIIYDQYLSEKATGRIKVETDISKRTFNNIRSKMLSEDVFDTVQARVYQILHINFYEEFIQTNAYVKLLGELGLLPHSKSEDGDTISIDDVPRIIWFRVGSEDQGDFIDDSSPETRSLDSISSTSSGGTNAGEIVYQAGIAQCGIVKEPNNKSYVVFAVTVKKRIRGTEEEDIWDVYRRYSDFHDLNMLLIEKFPEWIGPHLPPKTIVKNTSKEFLEKRRRALDAYFRGLLKPDMWNRFPGMETLVIQFLAPGLWEKHKSELARKMDTIVNPLKTSMKNVSNAVKNVDGVKVPVSLSTLI